MCIGAVTVILVFWALVAVLLVTQRSAVLEQEGRVHLLLARLLAARVERTLRNAEVMVGSLGNALSRSDRGAGAEPLRDLLKLGTTGLSELAAFDAAGGTLASSGELPRPPNESIRGWLGIAAQLSPRQSRLAPLWSWDGRYYVPIVSPLAEHRGVVVALIDTAYLTEPFITPEFGRLARVAVIGADGVVWSRRLGASHSGVGANVSGVDSYRAMRQGGETGHKVLPGWIDRVWRVDGFVDVGGRGILAIAGSPLDEVLEPWFAALWVYIGFAVVVSALIVWLALWMIASYKREHAMAGAMRDARDAAESNSRLKSEFVTTMSHELRTPLASIVGFAELLAVREFSPEARRDYAKSILTAGRHLSTIVNDLLDISKVEAGKMAIASEPVDINLVVARCVDMQGPAAQAKGLELTAQLDPGLPQSMITDPTRLTQILTNLLGNAIKFTERGAVRLNVVPVGDEIEFSVSDTGPGIAPEFHERIFERFRQGDPALALKHGGTGLGLPLVKSLTELMGGHVRFSSVPGQGSTFTVSLPVGRGAG